MGTIICKSVIRGSYIRALPSYPFTVEYLVVAGGGGGGDRHGGAGGAGGFRTGTSSIDSTNVNISLSILVGAGGIGNVLGGQTSGSNSCFLNICSTGGGHGSCYNLGPTTPAAPGGSGGAGGASQGGAPGNVPTFTPSQGNPGGSGVYNGSQFTGGGGGGACQAGISAGGGTTGSGGCGCSSTITGTLNWYAGGGGGGSYYSGPAASPGGCGGGGRGGSSASGVAGNVNTGGGGGGGGGEFPSVGGSGGSGIVIIRYPGVQRAIGGSITCIGGNTIHTFLSSANICFTNDFYCTLNPLPNVSYLVVAGGGGGACSAAGGGGAGGFRTGTFALDNSNVDIGISVIVGAGGATNAATGLQAPSGSNSCVFHICSTGGGGGGGGGPTTPTYAGRSGGSGGGSSAFQTNAPGNVPAFTPSQGNPGGRGLGEAFGGGGGGGGAGGCGCPGFTSPQFSGGPGGAGCYSSISGSNVAYAGGGGGGAYCLGLLGVGGIGGGGRGANNIFITGCNANVNSGGGGGAGGLSPFPTEQPAGCGGSGIVIISYPGTTQIATGGTSIYTCNDNTIHVFCSSGTLTFLGPLGPAYKIS